MIASRSEFSCKVGRALLMAAAAASLFTGVWGGLVRLYWSPVPLTSFNVHWVTYHGPLMVSGFLGTLIGVERAVAWGRWWGYSGPLLTTCGAGALALGVLGATGPLLITLSSISVLVATVALFLRHPSLDLGLLVLGVGAWLVGNYLWFDGWTIHQIVFWWMSFLLLTVFGERLELSRFLHLSRQQRVTAAISAATLLAGMLIRPWWSLAGERVIGAAMIAMAVWLLRHDVARRTVRTSGSPRLMAICLLGGYVWLGIVGLGLWMHEALPAYGVLYDSVLHAFFIGFVFSMIFAHAPIILPAVTGMTIPYTRWFYVPLLLLHGSLVVRIVGDILAVTSIASWPKIHGWGGLLNAAAIGVFLLTVFGSAVLSRLSRKRQAAPAEDLATL